MFKAEVREDKSPEKKKSCLIGTPVQQFIIVLSVRREEGENSLNNQNNLVPSSFLVVICIFQLHSDAGDIGTQIKALTHFSYYLKVQSAGG